MPFRENRRHRVMKEDPQVVCADPIRAVVWKRVSNKKVRKNSGVDRGEVASGGENVLSLVPSKEENRGPGPGAKWCRLKRNRWETALGRY